MLENEKIEFALALNLARFRKSVNVAVGKVQNMDRNIRKSLANSTEGFSKLRNQVLGIGVAATGVALGGLALLKKGITETVGLANIQEDAEIRAAAVIRATGGAAGFTVGQLRAMAGEFQNLTTVGDETTISAQSVLATFKEIKGDTFREATAAALDMNAVVGGDLKGNVIQLGKALNDPIRGVSALSRVGVSFTQAQKDMIKKLQESGDMMGAQQVILQELKSEFGGTAAALRGSFKGALTSAGNAWGDLYEQTGYAITKNNFFIESAKLIEQRIIGLTGKIKGNEQAMRDLAKNGALAVVSGVGTAVEVLRFFYNGWQGVKLAAHGALTLIIKGAEQTVKILRKVLFPLDLLLTGLAKIGFIDSNPLANLESTLKGFGDFSAGEFEKLYNKVEDGNRKFDVAKAKIAEFRAELNAIPATKVDVADEIQKQTDQAVKDVNNIAPKSYNQKDKSDDFRLVDGVWQQVQKGPVKSTVDNYQAPVSGGGRSATQGGSGQPDKVLRVDLPGGVSLHGDANDSDKVVDSLQQAGLTAQ